MIKRLWIVASTLWVLFATWGIYLGGAPYEVNAMDLWMIAFPWVIGPVMWRVGRWVFIGTWR